jgi:uncharacterized RDD family membrane protein YckC
MSQMPPPPPSDPSWSQGPPGYGAPEGPSGPRAGFWIRLAAALIDGIVLGIVGTLLRFIGGPILGFLVSLLLGFAYFGFFEGGPAGQTPGKKAVDIRVVRAVDGGPLGWTTALLRYLCSYLSGLACGLGYLWMLWDKEKQTWHDKLSATVVVPAAAWPPPPDSFAKPPTA